jgi:ATP-binding cassette subfamily B protein
MLKEHEHYEGEILVDGTPLRSIRRASMLDRAAVVLQETEVWNFTLRENLAIANPAVATDDALLREALEISHVTDFLPRLPQGVDTVIGEKGVRLSGGEKQRLGIARAIVKRPQILFLDEATSHLDSESEAKIRDSLHRVFQGVTAIVVAHRLSTIREMDRILVLEGGCLLEEGTFQELLARNGRFRELWEKQRF